MSVAGSRSLRRLRILGLPPRKSLALHSSGRPSIRDQRGTIRSLPLDGPAPTEAPERTSPKVRANRSRASMSPPIGRTARRRFVPRTPIGFAPGLSPTAFLWGARVVRPYCWRPSSGGDEAKALTTASSQAEETSPPTPIAGCPQIAVKLALAFRRGLPRCEISAVTEVAAEGDVPAPSALVARTIRVRIGDLPAEVAEPQRPAVDLLEEVLRPALEAREKALGLPAIWRPLVTRGEISGAQPLLLFSGPSVIFRC